MDLFERAAESTGPLADRMRPKRLAQVVGQKHLVGDGRLLARLIRADRPPSMVLWGPPGTGKTTLAQVVAHESAATFVPFSAVLGGVPELRKLIAAARERRAMNLGPGGGRTILFVDEIHRFNKAQQDALLPHVENGTVTLIGATTENPSFAVNSALLSRARVFRLESLDDDDVLELLGRAVQETGARIDDDAIQLLARAARGDARRALTTFEALAADGRTITEAMVGEALGEATLLHDKTGEDHFNVVSAFIKSMRGSDPDAAVYWMMRMLDAGEDPLFVSRRLLIFASEDIGNADPRALELAVSADAALQRLGMPEAMHALAQCATYLAVAPKSNASYRAFLAARADVQEHGALPVPMKLRNAATRAMKSWGYGGGYRSPHAEGGIAEGETYLPDALVGRRYYEPTRHGFEARIDDRLRRIRGQDSVDVVHTPGTDASNDAASDAGPSKASDAGPSKASDSEASDSESDSDRSEEGTMPGAESVDQATPSASEEAS